MISIFTLVMALGAVCFASGDTGSAVTSAIESAADSVKSDAAKVIASAVGVGVVFWGARVLWSKFKGMAK